MSKLKYPKQSEQQELEAFLTSSARIPRVFILEDGRELFVEKYNSLLGKKKQILRYFLRPQRNKSLVSAHLQQFNNKDNQGRIYSRWRVSLLGERLTADFPLDSFREAVLVCREFATTGVCSINGKKY